MTSANLPNKYTENKQVCSLLAELSSLKENNRELARSLAEKRKENRELRGLENEFNILQNKLKMNQEMYISSISNLESCFINACSQLLHAVEKLSILHINIQKEKRKSLLSDEVKQGGPKETGQSLNLIASHPIEQINAVLKDFSSAYQQKTKNAEDKENNVKTNNTVNVVSKVTKKEINYLGCSEKETTAHNDTAPKHSGLDMNDNNKKLQCVLDIKKENTQGETFVNNYSHNDSTISRALIKDGVTDIMNNDILKEQGLFGQKDVWSSRAVGNLHLEEKTNYCDAFDTYYFSQDEAFQNFEADQDSIVRGGMKEVLTLPSECAIPTAEGSQQTSSKKEIICTSSEETCTKVDDSKLSTLADESTSFILGTYIPNSSTTANTKILNVNTQSECEYSDNVNFKSTVLSSNSTMRHDASSSFQSGSVGNKSNTNVSTLPKQVRPLKKSDSFYRNSVPITDLSYSKKSFERMHQATRRKFDVCESQPQFSNSKATKTEMYLRRYKYLAAVNYMNDAFGIGKNDNCSGKENIQSKALSNKPSKWDEGKQRKPLREWGKEDILPPEQRVTRLRENRKIGSYERKQNMPTPRDVAVESSSEVALVNKNPQKKTKKKARKNKVNLRI